MSAKPHNHTADENSPLLNGGGSPALNDTLGHGNGNGHISLSRDSSTMTFLFDSKHTPGTDNSNIAVRSLAYSWHIIKVTLLSNYVNFLLVMVPLGIVAGKMGWSSTAVFTINFFAIIPLAAVLSFATEEFSMKLGETLGGLLNATFGNAVELIVSIVALQRNEIELVQASMLGSILSNLLLVMGMCFLFGGIIHRGESGNGREQSFSSATAQTTCSLMTLSSASLVLPAAVCQIEPCSKIRLTFYSSTQFLTRVVPRTRPRASSHSLMALPSFFSCSTSYISSSSSEHTATFSTQRTRTRTARRLSQRSLLLDLSPLLPFSVSLPFLSLSAPIISLTALMILSRPPELAAVSLV
ncbi:hypothetical protein FVER14953_01871 [Fusarium verticillioides]|nr:hypothetical protein FVER14953_01871 [Fusarium verticillioides]